MPTEIDVLFVVGFGPIVREKPFEDHPTRFLGRAPLRRTLGSEPVKGRDGVGRRHGRSSTAWTIPARPSRRLRPRLAAIPPKSGPIAT